MEELKKVEVIWLDAWSDTVSLTQKGIDDLQAVPRQSIGYLKKESANEIVLIRDITWWSKIGKDEDTFTDELCIPKGMIQKIITQRDAND